MRCTYIHNAAVALLLLHTCLFSPAIAGTRPSQANQEENNNFISDTGYGDKDEEQNQPQQPQKVKRVRNMHPELQIASPQENE